MAVLVLRDSRGASLVDALATFSITAELVNPLRFKALPFEPPQTVDWVLITSSTTVRMIADRWPKTNQVAAVGLATARVLNQAGITVDFVPNQQSGIGLGIELPITAGEIAWLPRSDLATNELPELLTNRGMKVLATSVYATKTQKINIAPHQYQTIVAFSPSGVRALPTHCPIPIVAIGNPTAQEVLSLGLTLGAIAIQPTDEKLAQAVVNIIMEETT